MALITLPEIVKGQELTVTLDKAELVNITADAFYQDVNNLKEIRVLLRSTVRDQKVLLRFKNLADATPSTTFTLDANADDVFEVKSVKLIDKQNGIGTTPRANLTVADFDIDLSPVVVGTNSADFTNTDTTLTGFTGQLAPDIVTFNYWVKISPVINNSPIDAVGFLTGSLFETAFVILPSSPGRVNFRVDSNINGNEALHEIVNPETVLYGDTWRLVTLISRSAANTSDVYLDGSLLFTATTHVHKDTFEIGGENLSALGDGAFVSKGKFSDIAIYGRELTPTEISNLYNNRSYVDPSTVSGLIYHYDFNSANGTTTVLVPDLVGNKNLTPIDAGTGAATTLILDADKVPGE